MVMNTYTSKNLPEVKHENSRVNMICSELCKYQLVNIYEGHSRLASRLNFKHTSGLYFVYIFGMITTG